MAQSERHTEGSNIIPSRLSPASLAIHADDFLNNNSDVAPALHLSTTFRYDDNPENLIPAAQRTADAPRPGYVYSRINAPNTTRLEAILTQLLRGDAITYTSGSSAFHALLVFLNPKRLAIGNGYRGFYSTIQLVKKLSGLEVLPLSCDAEDLQPGDILHVETPVNPTGELCDLRAYAEKAHSRGAYLTVDATFGPPPLQDPFELGADIVLHSSTKFIGGHSDILGGVLAVNPKFTQADWTAKLKNERTLMGSIPGSLESWLGIRSVRTLELRVTKQSESAAQLVKWLNDLLDKSTLVDSEEKSVVKRSVLRVQHGSLQAADLKSEWPKKQMPLGYGSVFAVLLKTEEAARRFPSKLNLFHHATSLGGLESLVEWRALSDMTVDLRLLRVSIGLESWQDLRDDFFQALKAVAEELNL